MNQKRPFFLRQDEETLNRDKKFLIAAGSIFFVVLIGILWFFNIQTAFNMNASGDKGETGTITEFRENLSETIGETRKEVMGHKATSSESADGDNPFRKEEVDATVDSLRGNLREKLKDKKE